MGLADDKSSTEDSDLPDRIQDGIYLDVRSFAGRSIDSLEDKSVEKEREHLEKLAGDVRVTRDALISYRNLVLEHTLASSRHMLSSHIHLHNSDRLPKILLRSYDFSSYTEFDSKLGFISSSWRTSEPASNFGELKDRGILSVENIKAHMEYRPIESEWISCSENTAWTLRQVNRKWPEDSFHGSRKIALVSVAKLQQWGIMFGPSRDLLLAAGGQPYFRTNPAGVHYTSDIHYLVHGWIPRPCIVKIFTLIEFRDICNYYAIDPGQ